MNFTIVKTLKCHEGKQPIHMRRLQRCSMIWAWKAAVQNYHRPQDNWVTSFQLKIWERFEAARKVYFERIRELHPDRGGDWQLCAELNSIWKQIKLLFARRGIGVPMNEWN